MTDIAPWLIHTVTVAAYTGLDSDGSETFAAQTTIVARVEYRDEIKVGTNQNQYVSRARFASLTEVGENSRVWLPGDNTANDEDARRVMTTENASTKDASVTLYMHYL